MPVKAAYTNQGILVGDTTENMDGTVTMENPVIAMPQGTQNIAFMPLLGLMEEKKVTLRPEDIQYGVLFTPAVDVRNHYNKMFGVGIIEASSNVLAM